MLNPVVPTSAGETPTAHAFTLSISGLRKSYGAVRAIRDVSMVARSGNVHAVIGENGAGKSTFVKALAGLIRPDAGHLECDGVSWDFAKPADAVRAGIAVAFQESGLVQNLTVMENLLLSRELGTSAPRGRRGLDRRAREILAGVPRRIDPGSRVRDLSLPERQMLEVARAVARSPKILVLDEANSALSAHDNEWFLETARRAADAGSLVLFITHRLSEVRAVADSLTVLRGGTSVLHSVPSEVTNGDIIEAMVGHRVEEFAANRSPVGERDRLVVEDLRPVGTDVVASLTVREGEIVGLAGLEGNGQEAVLLALSGAVRWAGRIELDGQPYEAQSPRNAIASGVALVPGDRQAQGLLTGWSIRDNIVLSSLGLVSNAIGFVDESKVESEAESIAERMKLPEGRLSYPVSSLSGGNQQRVVVGRVLLTKPKVLLLYDGTRGVDVVTRSNILRLMKELAESGMSVIFYSSDLSEYAQVAHRVLVMSGGRVVGVKDGDVTEQEILRVAVEAARTDDAEDDRRLAYGQKG